MPFPVCSLFYTFRENLISIDELISVMRQIQNIPEDKLQRIAEALDDNKDGKIDIDDVIKVRTMLVPVPVSCSGPRLKDVFRPKAGSQQL